MCDVGGIMNKQQLLKLSTAIYIPMVLLTLNNNRTMREHKYSLFYPKK
jgi:hypothetical protein